MPVKSDSADDRLGLEEGSSAPHPSHIITNGE